MLLHYIGEETCDIFDTLTVPEPDVDVGTDVYGIATKALVNHFEPQKCIDHHVYNFRKDTQKVGETVSEFFTRLQLSAKICEFEDNDPRGKSSKVHQTIDSVGKL